MVSAKTNGAYVPTIYREFVRDYPAVANAYEAFASAVHDAGPLDERTRRLVKFAAAVGAGSEGAVRSHARKALAAGISRQEIEHVILLAAPNVGLPTSIAALGWAREVFGS
ncbi:MAG: carboxymuconolactone decarboxylase family protein [Chloroflexota bacterium]|nr:MAG: carboxymuconolactone decarboxylase family protein [Chloroflexota bacterium]